MEQAVASSQFYIDTQAQARRQEELQKAKELAIENEQKSKQAAEAADSRRAAAFHRLARAAHSVYQSTFDEYCHRDMVSMTHSANFVAALEAMNSKTPVEIKEPSQFPRTIAEAQGLVRTLCLKVSPALHSDTRPAGDSLGDSLLHGMKQKKSINGTMAMMHTREPREHTSRRRGVAGGNEQMYEELIRVLNATKDACSGKGADEEGIVARPQDYKGMLPILPSGVLGFQMNPRLFSERTATLLQGLQSGRAVLLSDILRAAAADEFVPPVDVMDLENELQV